MANNNTPTRTTTMINEAAHLEHYLAEAQAQATTASRNLENAKAVAPANKAAEIAAIEEEMDALRRRIFDLRD